MLHNFKNFPCKEFLPHPPTPTPSKKHVARITRMTKLSLLPKVKKLNIAKKLWIFFNEIV